MSTPVGTFAHVVIDCADPERLAEFWSQALGVEVAMRWHQYVILHGAGEGQPGLAFQRVPEAKSGKNRVHLDLMVDDLDRAQARVEALGGRFLETHAESAVAVRVMADPEGNELCLVKLAG